jgi:hypothetical protein
MPLLVHGEVTDPSIDFFDREAVFIENILTPLLDTLPNLRVVMEHITTKQAAEFVAAAPKNVAASITPQHILWNRNSLFVGGLRPHAFCLPILKREVHREAVAEAAMSDGGKFFLGTDRCVGTSQTFFFLTLVPPARTHARTHVLFHQSLAAHRILGVPRSRRVAVQVFSAHQSHCLCTHTHLSRPGNSMPWRALQASTVRTSTRCRGI